MIRTPTCLILGAGASAHLGFPLGIALKDRMIREMQSKEFVNLASSKMGIPPSVVESSDHETFCRQLGFGAWASPDAFLEKHPEHIPLGKHLIASLLRHHEVENDLMTEKRGWYSALASALLSETLDEFADNRLSVITFNYDRSVDCLIHRLVQYRYGLDEAPAWDFASKAVPIVHAHGTLGPYPQVPYGGHPRSTESAASPIKIIHEVEDHTPEFDAAHEHLQRAEKIIVIGFAFAPQNVERLGLSKIESLGTRDVKIINGGMSLRQRASFGDYIRQWGFKPESCLDGDSQHAFSCYAPIFDVGSRDFHRVSMNAANPAIRQRTPFLITPS